MEISYSAPAKIILSGEHSVVYTKPAFVSAVNLRLKTTVKEGKSEVKDDNLHKAVLYCDKNVKNYLKSKKTKFQERDFIYYFSSEIPRGRGMGSSAAFCVALSASLLHFYTGHAFSKEDINTVAYKSEKFFHGMPSGVDVSASSFGGLIFYRKEFEFLKNISALNFKIPKNIQDNLIIIDTGKPKESTSEMVKIVGKNYNRNPQKMERVFGGIEKTTKKMVVSVIKEDPNLFSDCIEENQLLLDDLGIVSEKTRKLLNQLRSSGVGKVTGAGGLKSSSGLVLFLIKDKEDFQRHKRNLNLKIIKFLQDFEGVKQI